MSPYKIAIPIALLALFWSWETWRPFFKWPGNWRLRHAVRNLVLALGNTAILALTFGTATLLVADWAAAENFGLLHQFKVHPAFEFAAAILILDAWMYLWHRANHRIPLLWRFHRMHHSDPHMDVTTATRFHLGEHIGSFSLRLGIVALAGLGIWHVVAYEFAVIASTQFHHANISLGKWARFVRLILVTPDMHKAHHSRLQPETDSNYSTVFSLWDRIGRSFKMRRDPHTIDFGLDGWDADGNQTLTGMLKTPFASSAPPQQPGDHEK